MKFEIHANRLIFSSLKNVLEIINLCAYGWLVIITCLKGKTSHCAMLAVDLTLSSMLRWKALIFFTIMSYTDA